MKFSIFHDSRIGTRSQNQDRVGYWYTRDALLLVVADGMGGHLMGEVAAQIALEQLAAGFLRDAKTHIADPDLYLFRAVGRVHAAIMAHAGRLELPDSPRTTLVACIVQDGHAWWTHVGDSRLYLVRGGRLAARTRDHTRVQQLVDAGRMREESVSSHPGRNILLQCLGGARAPRIEPTASARLAKDDILLLCSDGFWGSLTQRDLLAGLAGGNLMKALPRLLTLAEARAGSECDNVSVVAMAWGEEEVPAPDALAVDTLPFHELPTDAGDFAATDPDFTRMQMSDDEIESEIAAIKAALKKHGHGKT